MYDKRRHKINEYRCARAAPRRNHDRRFLIIRAFGFRSQYLDDRRPHHRLRESVDRPNCNSRRSRCKQRQDEVHRRRTEKSGEDYPVRLYAVSEVSAYELSDAVAERACSNRKRRFGFRYAAAVHDLYQNGGIVYPRKIAHKIHDHTQNRKKSYVSLIVRFHKYLSFRNKDELLRPSDRCRRKLPAKIVFTGIGRACTSPEVQLHGDTSPVPSGTTSRTASTPSFTVNCISYPAKSTPYSLSGSSWYCGRGS